MIKIRTHGRDAVAAVIALSTVLGAAVAVVAANTSRTTGAPALTASASTVTLSIENKLADIRLHSKSSFRDLIRMYGNPTRIVNGNGSQSGGFGVGGYADAAGATANGGGAPGGGYPGASSGYPGGSSNGLGALSYPGGGGSAAVGAPSGEDQTGLVTWVYDNVKGVVGDSLYVTFDEEDNGRVSTIRVLGTRPYPTQTQAGIQLGDRFTQVLDRYGYPDMTVPLDYNHTAVYFFRYNVAFGFQGNGNSLQVDSITIGIGEQPQALPAGQAAGGAGGYPGSSGYPR